MVESLTVAMAAAWAVGVSRPALVQDEPPRANARAASRLLETVLARMSKDLGASIVAESALASRQGPLPAEKTTADNVEDQLDALVKALPPGTIWAKLMLPAPKGRGYRPDDLMEYLVLQSRLFGNVGASTKDEVEVLGQRLPTEKAVPVVSALNLKPYYVIGNPTARVSREGEAVRSGGDAQVDAMVRSFRSLSDMDPQSRAVALRQMMQSLGDAVRGMSPEQRADFMNSLRGGALGPGQVIIFSGDGRR